MTRERKGSTVARFNFMERKPLFLVIENASYPVQDDNIRIETNADTHSEIHIEISLDRENLKRLFWLIGLRLQTKDGSRYHFSGKKFIVNTEDKKTLIFPEQEAAKRFSRLYSQVEKRAKA